jgi:hypothetical protein
MPCGTILVCSSPLSSMYFSVASFSPVMASGTTLDTSCAKKPSTSVFVSSAIKLNLAGLSCFNLVVASKLYETFSLSL